jgi:membrane protein insertase Oxa1/YidC/SpoIIIJ
MKELQKKYKSDPQLQQQMLAKLYEENNVSGGGVSG